jgi:Protein of unknown function (DUF3800)
MAVARALSPLEAGEGYLDQAMVLAFPASVLPGDRFMVIFDAYFDESGTHQGADALTVAGYVSTPERWIVFEQEWNAALSEYGLDHFHMTKFVNRAPAYKDWTDIERRKRYARLVGIIERNTVASVGTVIPRKLFDSIMSEKAKRICGGPYGLAVSATFIFLARLVKERRPDGCVAYVFESGVAGYGEILKVLVENEQDPSTKEFFRLLSFRFENKRQLVPLQAADILAYELYKHYPRQEGTIVLPPRNNLRMLRFGETQWGYLAAQELRKWSEILTRKPEP